MCEQGHDTQNTAPQIMLENDRVFKVQNPVESYPMIISSKYHKIQLRTEYPMIFDDILSYSS